MIIADKNGWLVAAELITQTASTVVLRPFDDPKPVTVSKADNKQKVFGNVNNAVAWIKSEQL